MKQILIPREGGRCGPPTCPTSRNLLRELGETALLGAPIKRGFPLSPGLQTVCPQRPSISDQQIFTHQAEEILELPRNVSTTPHSFENRE